MEELQHETSRILHASRGNSKSVDWFGSCGVMKCPHFEVVTEPHVLRELSNQASSSTHSTGLIHADDPPAQMDMTAPSVATTTASLGDGKHHERAYFWSTNPSSTDRVTVAGSCDGYHVRISVSSSC